MKAATKLTSIGLCIILLCALFLFGLNTSWGQVKMSNVYFPDQQGNLLHGVLYKPVNANYSNPVPAVITVHGGNGYMAMMSNLTLELARRGYVVMALDCNGSGWSDYTPTDVSTNMVDANGNPLQGLENDGGVSRALEYVSSFDFVKENEIVLIGHSAGGTYCFNAAYEHQTQVKGAMVIASGGFAMRLSSLKPDDMAFNMAYIISGYDEWITAIMGVDKTTDLLSEDFLINAVGAEGPVEANKVYGSFDDNSARVIYTANTSHAGNLLNRDSISKMLEFTDHSVGQINDLTYTNQIYWLKEIISVVGVAGFILFLVGLALSICRTKFFSCLVNVQPRPVVTVSRTNKAIVLLIAAALPILIYYPIGLKTTANVVMPFRWANAFAVWSAASGVLILAVFAVWHFIWGKKSGGNMVSYGISTSATEAQWDIRIVLKAFLLAVLVTGGGYILLYLLYQMIPVEFGYWFFALMPIPSLRLPYLPVYFVFFAVSAAVTTMVNTTFTFSNKSSSRLSTVKQYVLPLAISIGGLAALMGAFYLTLRVTGHTVILPMNALDSVSLGSTFAVLPNFVVASLVSTAVYRKIKNTYVAVFLTALILAAITICPNSFTI